MLRFFTHPFRKSIFIALVTCLSFTCTSVQIMVAKAPSKIVVKDFAGRELTIDKPLKRVVALAAGDAQIVATLGGKIVGRPKTSNQMLPKTVLEAPVIGTVHTPDYEKITLAKPELIIANKHVNLKDVASLEKTGAVVYMASSESVDEIKENVRKIGLLLGQTKKAEATIKMMDKQLKRAASLNKNHSQKVLLVYGAPNALLVALPTSLAGDILTRAGGHNIATQFPKLDKMPGYAQLSTEHVMLADPEMVFLITHGDPKGVQKAFEEEISKNAAWSEMAAVKNNHVIVLPAHLFGTNPGTKISESVKYLATQLNKATE